MRTYLVTRMPLLSGLGALAEASSLLKSTKRPPLTCDLLNADRMANPIQSMHERGLGHGCPHSGFYSGLGVYVKESQTLRCVLVCDDCGEEIKEISVLDYAPKPMLAMS
jgi:hypothetical protein